MDFITKNELDDIILTATKKIECAIDTKAYIQSIFKEYVFNNNDLSRDNITIIYLQAKLNYDFKAFKTIADWLLYTKTIYPQTKMSQTNYYDTIAKDSYYMCYNILNKKWPLFYELSSEYQILVKQLQNNFKTLNSI